MKVVLDLDALQAGGRISPEEAQRLRDLAAHDESAPSRGWVMANVAMIFGALAVAVAVAMLQPGPAVGGALALAALGAGAVLRRLGDESWTLLSHALAIGGSLGAGAAFLMAFPELKVATLIVGLFLAAVALHFQDHVVAAFAPLAVGSWIGSGAGYWHAVYSVTISQPLVTVLVFAALAAGLFAWGERSPRGGGVIVTMARVAFVILNMGFWVGSLWGDDFQRAGFTYDAGRQAIIPAAVFAWAWTAALLLFLWIGLGSRRRFISNTALTFAGVHFYTRVFETFGARPWVIVISGVLLVLLAFAFVRFDGWQRARRAAGRTATPDDFSSAR